MVVGGRGDQGEFGWLLPIMVKLHGIACIPFYSS